MPERQWVKQSFLALGTGLAFLVALHSIYIAYAGQYTGTETIRAGVLLVCAIIVVCTDPLAGLIARRSPRLAPVGWVIDILLLANLAFACWNFLHKLEDMDNLVASFSALDQFSSLLAVLSVIELTRRVFGNILAVVALLALFYCLFGQDLPWIFRHSGFSLAQTMEIVWFGLQGIFGTAFGIVILLVFIFIVFGALLEGTGAGDVMIRMSLAATGGTRGGPAHAAIIASGVFGMSSGSVVANVVGTGVITIPLIKRRGFSGAFAGGVEAAASTGGQIMPPVMGAAAFIMAGLVGVPYQTIAIAALLPALFYYANLFIAVGLEARRLGLKPVPKRDRPKLQEGDWLKSLMFFLPVIAIIVVFAMGRSPSMAGFWAVVVTIASGLIINPALRRDPSRLFTALALGGIAGAKIIVAVGTIGLLIAVFNLTGLGLKFATAISLMGGESLFIALLLTAAACLVLGMGMPTLPAYLIIVLVLGMALRKMGVPDLPLHMFVFYFGVLSAVTPPVAMAAVAAAPIADSEPMRTGIVAVKLSIVGFVIPFAFVYDPTILLVVNDFDAFALVSEVLRLLFAIWLMSTALIGCELQRIWLPARALRLIAAAATISPIVGAQAAGLVAGAILIAIHIVSVRRSRTAASDTGQLEPAGNSIDNGQTRRGEVQ